MAAEPTAVQVLLYALTSIAFTSSVICSGELQSRKKHEIVSVVHCCVFVCTRVQDGTWCTSCCCCDCRCLRKCLTSKTAVAAPNTALLKPPPDAAPLHTNQQKQREDGNCCGCCSDVHTVVEGRFLQVTCLRRDVGSTVARRKRTFNQ